MAGATIAREDTLGGAAELIKLISGSHKTTTSTQKSGISQASADAMLKQLLEGTGGLADVSSGQRTSGLYNSSVNTMLANDLMTRSVASIEALRADKTTTTEENTDPLLDPKLALEALAAMIAANSLGLLDTGNKGVTTGTPGTSGAAGATGATGATGAAGAALVPQTANNAKNNPGGSTVSDSKGNVTVPISFPGNANTYGSEDTTNHVYDPYSPSFADSLFGGFDTYYKSGNTDFFDNLTYGSKDGYYPQIADAIWGDGIDTSGNSGYGWLDSLFGNDSLFVEP